MDKTALDKLLAELDLDLSNAIVTANSGIPKKYLVNANRLILIDFSKISFGIDTLMGEA